MTDIIMIAFTIVMVAWVSWLLLDKWQRRERVDVWADLLDDRDRESIG